MSGDAGASDGCGTAVVDTAALWARIAHLEMILRDVHDPLLISEALLRKHGYNATADMVKTAFDKVAALGTGPIQ